MMTQVEKAQIPITRPPLVLHEETWLEEMRDLFNNTRPKQHLPSLQIYPLPIMNVLAHTLG